MIVSAGAGPKAQLQLKKNLTPTANIECSKYVRDVGTAIC